MADLKKIIARRKAADHAFAVVGFLSITIGLATLGALLYTLVRDAQPRLRVPEGTVAVTEGEVKGPKGQSLTPEQQAWEARKISGDALQDLLRDRNLIPQIVVVEHLIDLEKIQALAEGLRPLLGDEKKLEPYIEESTDPAAIRKLLRTEHARGLVQSDKFGEFIALQNFMPRERLDELKGKGELSKLINQEKLRNLINEEGIQAIFNRRKLEGAMEEFMGFKPDILKWIDQGELRYRMIKEVLREDEVAQLIDVQALERFVEQEYQVAQARPREFNRSFFFTLGPSAYPETTGIYIAWVDSLIIICVTMLAALPVGVGAGIYLEEYGRKNKLTALIEINIANLAGVPSIVYGLMALGFFIYQLHMGRSILTAGLTLALLVLPIVILATREAIRAIPQNIREASYACGATKWQTVWYHILPYSSGGILTGSIIGLSRAIGETAPLITIGALTFVTSMPWEGSSSPWGVLQSGFTAMPLLMFNLTSRPQAAFHNSAALAGIVLIVMTLSLNGIAIYLRYRLRRSIKW